MNEEYVRKDVFDVELRRLDERFDAALSRMEAKIDAGISEMKAQNATFREHVTNELSDMNSKISALQAKVENITGNVALIMTIIGTVIAGITLFIQLYVR